jgi:hypothetical protein
MSAAASSKKDKEKEGRSLSEKRLSLSNGCFRIGDAIEWLQRQDVCKKAKNTYREAWRQIVLMTEAGGIAPVLAKDKLYDAKTWYVTFSKTRRPRIVLKHIHSQVLLSRGCNSFRSNQFSNQKRTL